MARLQPPAAALLPRQGHGRARRSGFDGVARGRQRGLHRFEGGEPEFRRWLFTIAARRRIDDIRASRSVATSSNARHASEWRATRSAAPVGRRRFRARAGRSIERSSSDPVTLPPDQAEAVLLRVVADLSVVRGRPIIGRREGTVRVLVHRGLKRLAERSVVTESPVRNDVCIVTGDDHTTDALIAALRSPALPAERAGEAAAVTAMLGVLGTGSRQVHAIPGSVVASPSPSSQWPVWGSAVWRPPAPGSSPPLPTGRVRW